MSARARSRQPEKAPSSAAPPRGPCARAQPHTQEVRTERVTVRLSKAEEKAIRQAARAERPALKPSCYLRGAALARARGEAAGSCPPQPEAYQGERCGVVRTPQGTEAACYDIRPVELLVTSHNPSTWQPDPRYPLAVQERDYRADASEKLKVERIANTPAADLLLALTPTAVDGPPVVSDGGIVLGGNGRTMGLRLAYARGTAGPYVEELRARAPVFGLTAAAVDAVSNPVLVRVVKGLDNASQPELADMSARLNEGLTNSLDERARAVSLSRRLSPQTMTAISAELEANDTLRVAMAASGPAFVHRLESDGIITAQNRAAMVDGAGALTELGKLTVEGAFLGLALGTPERIAQAAASTLLKVERLTPFLARVRARGNGHDLIPTLQHSMDLLHSASAAGRSVREYAGQGNMFGPQAPLAVVLMGSALELATSKKLAAAAKAWAAEADYNPQQSSLFSDAKSPGQTLVLFLEGAGVQLAAEERAELLAEPARAAA
jgi:hypothetical protein